MISLCCKGMISQVVCALSLFSLEPDQYISIGLYSPIKKKLCLCFPDRLSHLHACTSIQVNLFYLAQYHKSQSHKELYIYMTY